VFIGGLNIQWLAQEWVITTRLHALPPTLSAKKKLSALEASGPCACCVCLLRQNMIFLQWHPIFQSKRERCAKAHKFFIAQSGCCSWNKGEKSGWEKFLAAAVEKMRQCAGSWNESEIIGREERLRINCHSCGRRALYWILTWNQWIWVNRESVSQHSNIAFPIGKCWNFQYFGHTFTSHRLTDVDCILNILLSSSLFDSKFEKFPAW
jgi:hypothetical protein